MVKGGERSKYKKICCLSKTLYPITGATFTIKLPFGRRKKSISFFHTPPPGFIVTLILEFFRFFSWEDLYLVSSATLQVKFIHLFLYIFLSFYLVYTWILFLSLSQNILLSFLIFNFSGKFQILKQFKNDFVENYFLLIFSSSKTDIFFHLEQICSPDCNM